MRSDLSYSGLRIHAMITEDPSVMITGFEAKLRQYKKVLEYRVIARVFL